MQRSGCTREGAGQVQGLVSEKKTRKYAPSTESGRCKKSRLIHEGKCVVFLLKFDVTTARRVNLESGFRTRAKESPPTCQTYRRHWNAGGRGSVEDSLYTFSRVLLCACVPPGFHFDFRLIKLCCI